MSLRKVSRSSEVLVTMSLEWSARYSKRPATKAGRWVTRLTPGTFSRTESQLMRKVRVWGLMASILRRRRGMKRSTSKHPDSRCVKVSLISVSSSPFALRTLWSSSADIFEHASKMSLKSTRIPSSATFEMLYSASRP